MHRIALARAFRSAYPCVGGKFRVRRTRVDRSWQSYDAFEFEGYTNERMENR
jgi:hypothetical protein